MLPHIQAHQEQLRQRVVDLYKGQDNGIEKGEGSRGGKVIGHTKSGKPIYATNGMNHKHSDFTPEDHKDAAELNKTVAAQYRERAFGSRGVGQTKMKDSEQFHNQFAREHEEQATKKSGEKKEFRPGVDLGASFEKMKNIKKSITENLSPIEYQQLQKSRIAISIGSKALTDEELEKSATDFFEKGRKAAQGEVRKFGGKDYIKTANGWRIVGKNGGKHKDVAETLHGKKEGVGNDPSSKEAAHPLEQLDQAQVADAVSHMKDLELVGHANKVRNHTADHVVNALHDELTKRGGTPTFKRKDVHDTASGKKEDKSSEALSKEEKEYTQDIKDYFQDIADIEVSSNFSLKSIAKQHGLDTSTISTLLCNLEDTDVMADIAAGNYNSFDIEDSSQFNDGYYGIMEDLGLSNEEDEDE